MSSSIMPKVEIVLEIIKDSLDLTLSKEMKLHAYSQRTKPYSTHTVTSLRQDEILSLGPPMTGWPDAVVTIANK